MWVRARQVSRRPAHSPSSNRIGGRLFCEEIDGFFVHGGASVIHESFTSTRDLAHKMGSLSITELLASRRTVRNTQMGNKKAQRHHYLPQSYLKGFTSSGTKDGQMFVMEVASGRSFRTYPKNVAVERDFNHVEAQGIATDVIEQAWAPLEQEFAGAIERVVETQTFPGDRDYNIILNFLCLFAVRNPALRNSINQARERGLRSLAEIFVSDRRVWERQVGKLSRNQEKAKDVSFAEMKLFVHQGDFQFKFMPIDNLDAEFKAFDSVLPLIGKRIWSLFVAPANGPEFICSDHPVALTAKTPERKLFGLGSRYTEVFLPLHPRAGFFGVFEDPLTHVVELQPIQVARLNSRVAGSAVRHLYSRQREFAILENGTIRKISCATRNSYRK